MTYSTEQLREKAIQAYLNGERVATIAKLLSIGESSVYRWLATFKKTQSVARSSNPGS